MAFPALFVLMRTALIWAFSLKTGSQNSYSFSSSNLKVLIVERVPTRFNICCMLDKMFDQNQNILPTKITAALRDT